MRVPADPSSAAFHLANVRDDLMLLAENPGAGHEVEAALELLEQLLAAIHAMRRPEPAEVVAEALAGTGATIIQKEEGGGMILGWRAVIGGKTFGSSMVVGPAYTSESIFKWAREGYAETFADAFKG